MYKKGECKCKLPQQIRVSEDYSTSVSHIFSSPDGERTIIMAPASTSTLHGEKMEEEFGSIIRTKASMITTEISQVPLSGVLYLLQAARCSKISSMLDIDISPEVALGPAQLGKQHFYHRHERRLPT